MKIFKIFFSIFFVAFSMSLQGTLSPLAIAAKSGDLALMKTIIQEEGLILMQKMHAIGCPFILL
jgi:hypothetical protein